MPVNNPQHSSSNDLLGAAPSAPALNAHLFTAIDDCARARCVESPFVPVYLYVMPSGDLGQSLDFVTAADLTAGPMFAVWFDNLFDVLNLRVII